MAHSDLLLSPYTSCTILLKPTEKAVMAGREHVGRDGELRFVR